MALIRIPKDKARRYIDTVTGKTYARRQGDILSGRLKYTSYEAKAKANKAANPVLAASRPARNKSPGLTIAPGDLTTDDLAKIRKYKPLTYTSTRYINMAIDLYFGTLDEMRAQSAMSGYATEFDRIQLAMSKKPDAIGTYVVMHGIHPDGTEIRVIPPDAIRRYKGYLYTLDELLQSAANNTKYSLKPGTVFTRISFNLGFNNTPKKKPRGKNALKIPSPSKTKHLKRITKQEQEKKQKAKAKRKQKSK
jgi:hypothetical protein